MQHNACVALRLRGLCARAGLADFDDASHLYDGGFSLPLCKISGLLMIDIGARKPLTVLVEQGHLPMMVLAPCVFRE
jgi:hypothetical protein